MLGTALLGLGQRPGDSSKQHANMFPCHAPTNPARAFSGGVGNYVAPRSRHAVVLDVGGTRLRAASWTRRGALLTEVPEPTPDESDAEAVTAVLLTWSSVRAEAPDVDAIGLGPAGIVEWPAGRIAWAPNNAYRDWPVREQSDKATGLPVTVDNDANVAAL